MSVDTLRRRTAAPYATARRIGFRVHDGPLNFGLAYRYFPDGLMDWLLVRHCLVEWSISAEKATPAFVVSITFAHYATRRHPLAAYRRGWATCSPDAQGSPNGAISTRR